ncbi:cupin domain-containing protein [Oribacterium sp. oral taxon 102]|uniref:cupin domain-containing protein n=1 Tax=Oribacterium sp. oral taxon 102 TaxID=671214 RepID=UPI0015BB7170|nr:cupin domain-containing protein [Oribacterium sp. oral taxon 102]NWO22144.1 cupin domain-containing protein [Oribacterium sp. oral taxon 102]
MSAHKDERWFPYDCAEAESGGEGVEKRVLAYSKDLMVVENSFEKGAVGKLHHHPHTQITYVKSGVFEFTIGEEKRIVREGDTLLKTDGVEHGCVCLEAGQLLDIFTPYREDFVED